MVILALDTSSAAGSAAISRDGDVAIEHAGDATRTHGQRLPRELMTVLADAGVPLRDVDVFAVATGPGSFTGLRVGIATIQGLALAQRKLVIPVSSFEALAFLAAQPPASSFQPPASSFQPPASSFQRPASSLQPPAIATWIDAHRGEVFAMLYAADGVSPLAAPSSLPPEATLDAWATTLSNADRIRFTGDGAIKYADVIAARLGARAVLPGTAPLLAGAIARVARVKADAAVRPHAVLPLYVRRSDAELARDRRKAQP